MLSTVAGSMITIAGVVFWMTLVALSLASSQLGPRLLRNFMRDTRNQVVLGTFIATFVYCLLVENALFRLERRRGQYVVMGCPLVTVWPRDRVTEPLKRRIDAAFIVGHQRTASQDIESAIHDLVEIAVRALFPGINDPFTAITCVDRLGRRCIALRNGECRPRFAWTSMIDCGWSCQRLRSRR